MILLQLSDLHIAEEGKPAFGCVNSLQMLQETVSYILHSGVKPDVAVVTGDISTDGSESSYRMAKAELDRLGLPVYMVPGNHDDQTAMERVYRDSARIRTVFQPLLEQAEGVDLVLLNSSVDGQSYGSIRPSDLSWLKAQVPLAPDNPMLVFMHHVPFATGYTVMDEPFERASDLLQILAGYPRLLVCCGHIHAGIIASVNRVSVITCPPVSMTMDLNFGSNGGDAFFIGQPAFALHIVRECCIQTHFCCVPYDDTRRGPFPF